MKVSDYLQKSSALFDENRLLKYAFVVMAVAFCFNSWMTYRAVKYQRTILIPPNMTEKIEFIDGQPDEKYVRGMSRIIANLAGTYSPSTVRENFEELLYYYLPQSYPNASKIWYSLASRAEEGMVSSAFYLEKIHINATTIELFGQLVQYTGTTPLENASRTYFVDYKVQDGRFYILSIKEKALQLESNTGEEKP